MSVQAENDLIEAVSKAIENKRGDIAVDGINCLLHKKQAFPTPLAISAVKCWIVNYSQSAHIQYEVVEIIKYLQSISDADVNDVCWIEFQLLKVLDHLQGAAPVMLERRLSTDPKFFHEMLTKAYIPESEIGKPRNLTEEQKRLASHIFGLLHHWQTPPGSTKSETMNENDFKTWVEEVKTLSEESGHWAIAQQLIGHTLTNSPAGIVGLLSYPEVAKVLDSKMFEEMRRGFSIALFNSRGVYGFSHGEEEQKLATFYRDHAQKYELAGFPRIAAELRSVADSYQRDSERESARDPYGN
jgi:hypothetical protein